MDENVLHIALTRHEQSLSDLSTTLLPSRKREHIKREAISQKLGPYIKFYPTDGTITLKKKSIGG